MESLDCLLLATNHSKLLDGENTPQVFFYNHSVPSRHKAAGPSVLLALGLSWVCSWMFGSLGSLRQEGLSWMAVSASSGVGALVLSLIALSLWRLAAPHHKTSKEKESLLTHALMTWLTQHKTVRLSLLFHYIVTVSFQVQNRDLSTWQDKSTGNTGHILIWLSLEKATVHKPHRNMAMTIKTY